MRRIKAALLWFLLFLFAYRPATNYPTSESVRRQSDDEASPPPSPSRDKSASRFAGLVAMITAVRDGVDFSGGGDNRRRVIELRGLRLRGGMPLIDGVPKTYWELASEV